MQLINRVFREAMLALGVRVRAENGRARVWFDEGFKALTGLEDLSFSITDRIRDINLEQYNIEIRNDGGRPTICVGLDLEERGSEIGLIGPDVNDNMAIVIRVALMWLLLMLGGVIVQNPPNAPDTSTVAAAPTRGL